jgi:hypothetical protein
MQEYETITMPEGGLGSFFTSNLDEIDDNVLMFGNAGGINSMKEVADRMAKMGREGDTFVVHASEKEVMVPREVAENNPQLVGQIKDAIAAEGADPEAYVVGSDRNSINPMTGQREFFLKKLVKGIKKVFKKAAKIIVPLAINYFAPGVASALGFAGTAAVGAGIGGLIQGESFGDALKSAAIGGITAGIAGGVYKGFQSMGPDGPGFFEGFKSGVVGTLPAGYRQGAEKLLGMGQSAQAAPEITQLSQLNPEQLEYATRLDALKPNLGEKVLVDSALNAVPGTAAAAGGSSVLGTAVKYGLPTLLAAGSMGAFDPIPAEEIKKIAGTDITNMTDPSNPLADSLKIVEANPEDYLIGQPGNPNYITPTQAIYSGQPLTTAAYLPSQGTYNPIVPSATYVNLTPTGAGTAPITPSGTASSSPEVAEVQLAGFDPRVTGMSPAPIYGIDAQGRAVMSPYDVADVIMPARFVGSNQEVQMAANGGAMNFPRRTGQIEGPGTETSDDIPAMLSDGEFVMTAKAVKNAGGGSREQGFRKMYDIMRSFEGGAVA